MVTYLLVFRHTDTGLPINPTTGMHFLAFKKVSDNSNVTPQPTITELSFGFYKFEYDTTFDIYFVVDGGDSLPDAVRYKSGNLTPFDY